MPQVRDAETLATARSRSGDHVRGRSTHRNAAAFTTAAGHLLPPANEHLRGGSSGPNRAPLSNSAQVMVNVAEQLAGIKSALQAVQHLGAAQSSSSSLLVSSAKSVDEAFKSYPEQLKSKLIKEARYLSELFEKRARVDRHNAQKVENPKRMHPRAESILKSTVQLSKEDLQLVSPFNIATAYEALRSRHASETQLFFDDMLKQQTLNYEHLTTFTEFQKRVIAAFDQFEKESVGESEPLMAALKASVGEWTARSHTVALASFQKKFTEKQLKDAKFKAAKADAESKLADLSEQQETFAAMLEAQGFTRVAKPGSVSVNNPLKEPKKSVDVQAGSVLGKWAVRHPDIAKAYGVNLVGSTVDTGVPKANRKHNNKEKIFKDIPKNQNTRGRPTSRKQHHHTRSKARKASSRSSSRRSGSFQSARSSRSSKSSRSAKSFESTGSRSSKGSRSSRFSSRASSRSSRSSASSRKPKNRSLKRSKSPHPSKFNKGKGKGKKSVFRKVSFGKARG
eukprot:TRINITY_DN24186_c0_g1_i1.p1 TRINITY_DN24186_c0_g1~~TRINITY_DN24186_c0_g1_i1.p1  ORF type:complete len:509 (-),score=81.25 TRINITY_DN24186_c0_g1_i1:489-2015(-)